MFQLEILCLVGLERAIHERHRKTPKETVFTKKHTFTILMHKRHQSTVEIIIAVSIFATFLMVSNIKSSHSKPVAMMIHQETYIFTIFFACMNVCNFLKNTAEFCSHWDKLLNLYLFLWEYNVIFTSYPNSSSGLLIVIY